MTTTTTGRGGGSVVVSDDDDDDESGEPIVCIDWGDNDEDEDGVGTKGSSGSGDDRGRRRRAKGLIGDEESGSVAGHTVAESDQEDEGEADDVDEERDIIHVVEVVLNKIDVPCCEWGALFYLKETDGTKKFERTK